MLDVTSAEVRIFLHILAATIWIGGQVILVAIVPLLRPAGPEVVAGVARRFRMVAWPAYGALLLTGAWNLIEEDLDLRTDAWISSLSVKLWLVVLSGAAILVHQMVGARAGRVDDPGAARKMRMWSGMLAGLGLLAAIASAFFGTQLARSF